MRSFIILFMALVVVLACSTKKQESSSSASDTTAVDTVLATTPAAPLLAFEAFSDFSVLKGLATPDSVNYFLLTSEEDFNSKFSHNNGTLSPDFVINYVLGVVCKPGARTTDISVEKIETGESSINVYLKITRGAPGATSTPSTVVSIEKREGYPVMQFFVNGKKDKSLVLVM